MTLAAPTSGGVREFGGGSPIVHPASVKGVWTEAVSNAQATAATSGELKAPLTFAGSNCNWVKVHEGATRVVVRTRYEATTVTAAPVVYIFGAFIETDPSTTTNQFATGTKVMRLDAVQSGTGLTLTSAVATDISDGTYQYGDGKTFTSPYTGATGDLCGAAWVLVLCSTAANVSGGNDTCAVELAFL